MAGTTNFVQTNPAAANQENDATYGANALTTGGVGVNDILPSPWLNKVWFQSSTFVAALAAVMAGWGAGLTITDASISALQTAMIAFFNNLGASKFSNPTVVTGSRSYGVQYQNTNATALFVNVTGNEEIGVGNNASAVAYIGASSASAIVDANSVTNGPGWAGVSFFVPPNWYYEVQTHVTGDTGPLSLQSWTETL